MVDRRYQISFRQSWWNRDDGPTVLHSCIPEWAASLPTHITVCITGKKGGGGVAIYANERWCKKENMKIRQSVSTLECEILFMSFRPVYLPRDFGQLFYIGVSVPPKQTEIGQPLLLLGSSKKLSL